MTAELDDYLMGNTRCERHYITGVEHVACQVVFAVRDHICKLCMYCKHFAVNYMVRYTAFRY